MATNTLDRWYTKIQKKDLAKPKDSYSWLLETIRVEMKKPIAQTIGAKWWTLYHEKPDPIDRRYYIQFLIKDTLPELILMGQKAGYHSTSVASAVVALIVTGYSRRNVTEPENPELRSLQTEFEDSVGYVWRGQDPAELVRIVEHFSFAMSMDRFTETHTPIVEATRLISRWTKISNEDNAKRLVINTKLLFSPAEMRIGRKKIKTKEERRSERINDELHHLMKGT